MYILFVDDDLDLLAITKQFLEQEDGWNVAITVSADDAIRLLSENTFDAIIADYEMEGMSGIDLLKIIRAEGDDIPFIIFTGKGREEVVIAAYENGADGYVQKGLDVRSQFAELSHKIYAIIQKRRTELAYKKSEQKYRQLFEKNSVGIALHEIIRDDSGAACDYRFIDINPAYEQMTSLSAAHILGRTVLEVLPGTEPYWIETYGRVACSGNAIHFEQFSQELHKYFDVTAYAPSTDLFVTIIQDVTKRKEGETRLIEVNAYLENLISLANVPIIVWDSDLRITRINRSFELLIGLSSGDVTGRPLSILFPYDRVDQCMRLICTTHSGVRWETVEIPIAHSDGTVRFVIWNSSTIYSSDGKTPVATIAQGRDITDEKILEQEKAKAMVQIQENIAQLAILNDGIRNPLTVISMYADMIGDQKLVQGILDEVTRVDGMVRNLDQEWVHSIKILDHLRKQGHITADFPPAIASCVDDTRYMQIGRPGNLSHQQTCQGQFIEEVQAQLYMILDSIDALVYVTDLETYDILYINEKGRALFGNIIGQKCYTHIHHKQGDPCPFCTNHLLMNESGPTGVYRWEFHNTRTGKWYDCRDRAIRWTDGRIARLEIATNITNRKLAEDAVHKKAEELHAAYEEITATDEELRQNIDDLRRNEQALQESEEKYRTVFENTGTATVVLEENGIISLTNNEFVHLSGFSKEDIEGKKRWAEFVVPEDLQRMLEQNQIRLHNEKKALIHYEFRFVTKNRDIRDIYLTIGVVPGTKKSIASLLDITAWNQAEEAIRESEERYREFFTLSRDCVFITLPDGQWIDFNDATLKIFGYESRESFFSINVSSLYADPGERPKFLSHIKQSEYVNQYPMLLKQKDGTLIETLISTAPLRNSDGSLKAFIGSIQVTGQRVKEEEPHEDPSP